MLKKLDKVKPYLISINFILSKTIDEVAEVKVQLEKRFKYKMEELNGKN